MPDRVALVDQLWDSIDREINKNVQAAIQEHWAAESEDRIDAVDRGDLETLDGREVLAQLRRSVVE